MNENIEKTLKIIKQEIVKKEMKAFKLYFFVYDTKGTPSGGLTYIYQMALSLKKKGYDVNMLYSVGRLADGTKEVFVGVGEWLGEEYASLPHFDVEENSIQISASDILFIPEVYANVMAKTKGLPCKRVAIVNNYDFMTENIPVGASWGDLKIDTCIASTHKLANTIKEVFPHVDSYVIRPAIDNMFNNKNNKDKKLIINIVSKDQNDINAIVKPFKWKHPIYNFVTFQYVNGLTKSEFAEALRNSMITIWNDPFTDFGASALEAMACGNIVIGKIPEGEPEWFVEHDDLKDNGIWYYNTRQMHALLASAIQTCIHNAVPEKMWEEMENTVAEYRPEKQEKDIENVFKVILDKHERYLNDKYEEISKKAKEMEEKGDE